MTPYRKKLIEVALPLEAINVASAREKSIRHGHPSTLHLWWARRPLAACRAVLFASLVDDPSSDPMFGGDEDIEGSKRGELFNLIEELVHGTTRTTPASSTRHGRRSRGALPHVRLRRANSRRTRRFPLESRLQPVHLRREPTCAGRARLSRLKPGLQRSIRLTTSSTCWLRPRRSIIFWRPTAHPYLTRSVVAAQSRWRPSGLAFAPMDPTSTQLRCLSPKP